MDSQGILNQTRYTQPCMVAFAAGLTAVLKEQGIVPSAAAGLSLGEYSALHAAGVFDAATAVKLVAFRGKAMEEAAAGRPSAMMAVLGLDRAPLQAACDQASALGCVVIANYNCPGQLVIGGEKAAVEQAATLAKEAGARRCLPLKVSGPFHSKLLTGAGEKLAGMLETVPVRNLQIPYVCNLEARIVEDKEEVKPLLVGQISGPVRFRESILALADRGVDTFVEMGPGKTLNGFIRKICPEAVVYNVEKVEDLEVLKAALCAGKEQA